MISSSKFPPNLLDEAPSCHNGNQNTPCNNEFCGRIWNIFDLHDLETISIHPDERNPVLRIYDLSLIRHMGDNKLNHIPIILSHLIELTEDNFPMYEAGIAIEVANRVDLEIANSLPCSLVIGKSFEAPGPSKESSAFIIYQLLKVESQHPFYIHGVTDYTLFQAYLASGVKGIVLPSNQFEGETSHKTIRFSLDKNNIIRLAFAGGTPEAIPFRDKQRKNPEIFLKTTFEKGVWGSEKHDFWGDDLREKTLEYIKIYSLSPRQVMVPGCFFENSPAAREIGCKYPFFQKAW